MNHAVPKNSKIGDLHYANMLKTGWSGSTSGGFQARRGAARSPKDDKNKFRSFLAEMKGAKNIEDAHKVLEKFFYSESITNAKIHVLTFWASVLHPDWFAPLHGSSKINKHPINKTTAKLLGIERISDLHEYHRALAILRESCQEIGVNDMVKAAYYMMKVNS